MRLVLDKDQIVAFAIVGDLPSSVDMAVPDDFATNFAPGKYVVKDGEVQVDPSWVEPKDPIPEFVPSPEQQSITSLTQLVAEQNRHIESLEQSITLLAQGGK